MKPRYLPKFIFSESRLLVQKELHMLEGDCSQQEDTHLCVCVFVKKKTTNYVQDGRNHIGSSGC